MATVTITARTRALGYGWTNEVEQYRTATGSSYLAVRSPYEQLRGSLRQVEAEWAHAQRLNRGNDWRDALFLRGDRVLVGEYVNVGTLLYMLRETGSVTVETLPH